MPIVTIQVTREGTTPGVSSVTAQEKAALIKGAGPEQARRYHFCHYRRGRDGQLGVGGLPVAEFRRRQIKTG